MVGDGKKGRALTVAILGGGVSGLAIGRMLREEGFEVDIFEKDEETGGLCRSVTFDGYVCDVAGGHILYSKDERALRFILDCVGEENFCHRERQTKIYYRNGEWIKYPFENGVGGLPLEDRFECVMGYIEAYVARRTGGGRAPGNFHDWVLYRMGEGFAKHFMFPYNRKIWKVDLHELSSDWVEGRVPEAPVEDVVKAALGFETEGYTHQSRFRYPLTGGYQRIPDAIGSAVEDRTHLRTPVDEVRRAGEEWIVNGKRYDIVVSTIPAPELVRVLEGAPEEVREAAARLRYLSLASILIGLNHDDVPPYSWIYLPFEFQGPANRVTYLSNYSPGNAPEGRASLQAEVTFAGESPIDAQAVRDLVDTYHGIGLIRKSDVVVTGHTSVRYAYIVHDIEFRQKIQTVLDYLDGIGLHSVGRFARFEYLNSDQCVAKAMALKEAIVERYCEKGD